MRSWVEYKKTMRQTPDLWSSAKTNDTATLLELIHLGHAVNNRDSRGYSPLMLAVYSGQEEAAQLLITLGADVNSADFAGNTILMGAAFKGHLTMIKTLLAHGARVSDRNNSDLTAADFAPLYHQLEGLGELAADAKLPGELELSARGGSN